MIHLVSNSHIDPVWLWNKYEGIDEVINTFRSACDRLDETPGLYFSASSLQFYEWVQKYDPKLFDRIRAKVAEGRWEITGFWWVEPDCNLPCSISFYKQAEISQEFTRKYFDVPMEVAFLPDSFGHAATLPKILAETGFKYYVFCRPDMSEKQDLPNNLFYWEYEGHRILCYRLRYHYTHKLAEREDALDLFKKDIINGDEFSNNPVNCFFFGIGNHGGGPSKKEIKFYNEVIKDQGTDVINYSTCLKFFKAAEKRRDIPVYKGDLHYHAIGCYSVLKNLKKNIRESEQGLLFAEQALTMADQSKNILCSPWKKTLFNQFHDIMPGSCFPEAEEQALAELGSVRDSWESTAYDALKSISAKHHVANQEGEFRIFNTLSYDITLPLSIESFMYYKAGAPLMDTEGNIIQTQEVLASVSGTNRCCEFVDTLPAQSFKSYYFDSENTVGIDAVPEIPMYQAGNEISTSQLNIQAPGNIRLKQDGEDCFEPILKYPFRFNVLDDESDTWGHNYSRYDNIIGSFQPCECSILPGIVVSKLNQKYCYEGSTINITYSLN